MKKFLHLLALFCLVVVGFGSAYAQTYTLDYTLEPTSGSNNAYANNCDITIEGITWNLEGNSQQQPWRIGGNSISETDRALYSKTPIKSDISKVEMDLGEASSITINSFIFFVSKNTDFSSPIYSEKIPVVANNTNTIIKPNGQDWSNCYFKFLFNVTVSGKTNRFIEFARARFYSSTSLSGGSNPIEFPFDSNVPSEMGVGDTYTLNLGDKIPSGFEIISEYDNIATVTDKEPYIIKAVSPGTANFVATWEGDENFTSGDKDFSITVKSKESSGGDNDSYVLVTDVKELGNSADIIIVNVDDKKVLGTTQNSTNRKAEDFIFNEDFSITPGNNAAIIKAEKVSNGYTLYITNGNSIGYLYASSSSSNELKTRDANSDGNSVAAITINDSEASLIFQGGSSRKYLRYNPNTANSNPLFSCYGSASQNPVKIYKKVSSTTDPEPPVGELKEYIAPFNGKEYKVKVGETIELETGSEFPIMSFSFGGDNAFSLISDSYSITITGNNVGGPYNVTASWPEDEVFKEGSATFSVEVVNAGEEPQPGNDSMVVFIANGASYNGNAESKVNLIEANGSADGICNIDFSANPQGDASSIVSNEIRWMSGAKMTVSPEEGIIIKKITWTDTNNKGGNFSVEDNNGTVTKTGSNNNNAGYWEGSSTTSIKITSGGQIRTPYVEVEYELVVPPTPELPVVKIGDEELDNNGTKTVIAGTKLSITSIDAKAIKGTYNDKEINLTSEPFEYTINESGTLSIQGVNGKISGKTFTYTFEIGEIDSNMPAEGSNFRQVKSIDEITEGYYVIARPNNSKSMSKVPDTSNNVRIAATDVFVESIDTGSKTFNLLTTSPEALIVYIEEKDGNYGIKTVNYKDGFSTSQGYLANPTGNELDVVEDFTPVYFNITSQYNTDIKFAEDGNKITINSNGDYFNLASGNTVQLYKYTTAKKFEPDFENPLAIPQGESRQMKPKNESYPEISYRVKGNTTIISIEEGSDVVKTDANRTSDELKEHPYVVASWDESDKWFAGESEFQVIVKYYLNAEQFGFRYAEVRGKKDVGVLSQAAYYAGTGTVTYKVYSEYNESNPEECVETNDIIIDANTGMIRKDDIKNAIIGHSYYVEANVTATEDHLEATRYYTLIIEAPDEAATGSKEEDFRDNTESHWGDKVIPTSYVTEETTLYSNTTGITYIACNYHIVSNSGYSIQFSRDNGGYISFTLPNQCKSITISKEAQSGNQNNDVKLLINDDENNAKTAVLSPYGSVTFNTSEYPQGATIKIMSGGQYTLTFTKINFEIPEGSSKPEAGLAFDDSAEGVERYFNLFEDETIKLPIELQHAEGLLFEDIELDIDEINEMDDDENFKNYEIVGTDWNDIKITVHDPGVYTFRAKYDKEDGDFLSGFAILRLNVFPRLPILPSENDDTSLADDERTLNPALTLVNSIKNDEGEDVATISLPNIADLENDFKYSTINVTKVEIKHGDKIIRYIDSANAPANVKARAAAEENNIVEKNISELPTEFRFSEDGSITYGLTYASTSQFYNETTVHVVFMPDWIFEKGINEKGDVTATATATNNSELLYRYFVYNPTNPEIPTLTQNNKQNVKSKVVVEGWQTAENGTHTFSIEDSNNLDIPSGQKLGVSFVSVKDITSTGLDLEDPLLAKYGVFTINGNVITAINEIETEEIFNGSDTETKYFNLQGVKVDKPAKGIYIIVKDGKSQKVIF